MSFIDRVKKRASQFSYSYESKDSSTDFYPPYFYQRLNKQIKAQGIELSPEAVDHVVNIRSFKYISGLNLLHRVMHDMNSPDEIDMNPREKRYHDLQYADSLTWLIIKIADDIVDNQTQESGIVTPKEVTNYISSIVFNDPKTIPEIRATQDQKVAIASADTSLFFIMGAGDKKYQTNYFPNESQTINVMRYVSTAASYEDAYKDFHEDMANMSNTIQHKSGDRMWFLFAMVKEIADHLPELDNKQATHISAVSARQVVDVFKRLFSEKKADERMEKYQKILGDAKEIFLGKSKGIKI